MSLLKPKWLFKPKLIPTPYAKALNAEIAEGQKHHPKAVRCAVRLRDNMIANENTPYALTMRKAYGEVLEQFGYRVPSTAGRAKALVKNMEL